MNLESLHTLLQDELSDIYDAEKRSLAVLPKLAKAATDNGLKDAFTEHLEESKIHIERLNNAFEILGTGPSDIVCDAARGLTRECEKIIESPGDPAVKDAALIGGSQRLEHYEMAAYGTSCALARELGFNNVAEILHETLEEEQAADKKLSKLAQGGIFSNGINRDALSQTV